LGCGTGKILESILRERKDIIVVGVDISLRSLLRGIERKRLFGLWNKEYVACDIRKLPFRPGSFDSSLCHMVLHHCSDLESVLGEVRLVLKKGGHIVIVEKVRNPVDILAKFIVGHIRALRVVLIKMGDHMDFSEQLPFTIYRSTFEYEKALLEHDFLIINRVYYGLLLDWLEYFVNRWFRGARAAILPGRALLFEKSILERFHGAVCNNVCFYARLR
jgi:SAM-dependent methyltransferase